MKIKGSLPGSLKKFCSRGPTGGPSQTVEGQYLATRSEDRVCEEVCVPAV